MGVMLGSLRLFLAFFVVFSHLVGTHYLQHFGFYAVRGFYVLSGFLMTASLNDLYAFDARRYFTNRLLRLMPLYSWFACSRWSPWFVCRPRPHHISASGNRPCCGTMRSPTWWCCPCTMSSRITD